MEEEQVKFWMVMHVWKWEKLTLGGMSSYGLTFPPMFGTGFCRVFDTYEEAEKYADGQTIVCVEGKRSPKESA